MPQNTVWQNCLEMMREELSDDEVNSWLMPLHTSIRSDTLKLLAPNQYVLNYIRQNLLEQIKSAIFGMDRGIHRIQCEIGSHSSEPSPDANNGTTSARRHSQSEPSFPIQYRRNQSVRTIPQSSNGINREFTFANHVEGNSNHIARAAAMQVGKNPGNSYNPLFIYGGVGLGKTHLMQAAGNQILESNPEARVVYIRSELFVNDMVTALRTNTMNDFKQYYRSLSTLLIDDIQFFARKTQTQEEFFHTFNALLEGQNQIIITSDRMPQAIDNVEERLLSRFSSGLTVAIDPPELETRVAILEAKAKKNGINLPSTVAFFVANAVQSNVRELEGALHRIIASAGFRGQKIDMSLAETALRDILVYRESRLTIEHIQKTVAEYFNVRVSDLISKRRSRDIARPRQMAMYLIKELTNYSLPKIGDHFGGRDHSTVIHACRKTEELIHKENAAKEDYQNLVRLFRF